MNAKDRAAEKISETIDMAERLFNVTLSPTIRWDLRGQAAGQAGFKGLKMYMRFNETALELDPDHLINQTIPHEVAHLVCFMRPDLGKNHNKGWKVVFRMLGGAGDRCHNIPLPKARKMRKFLYGSTCGKQFELSSIRHKKIQQGMVYNVRGGGKIRDIHYVKEVV